MDFHWYDTALDQLLDERDRLHHALLLEGIPGTGKREFALALCAALLCEGERTGNRACGQCQACGWFAQGNHPDFRRIRPESQDPDFAPKRDSKPSRHIRIEQIRRVSAFINIGAHRGGRKLVMIDPAETMNPIAANGLLKTLEEPAGNTSFVLVCSQCDALPATIRSRCRRVALAPPETALATEWLQSRSGASAADVSTWLAAAGGSPFRALELAEPAGAAAHRSTVDTLSALPETSLLEAADRLVKVDAHAWMPVVRAWISDLARVAGGGHPRFLPDQHARMHELSKRTSLDRILGLEATITRSAATIDHPLNQRLFVEGVLLQYCGAFEQ